MTPAGGLGPGGVTGVDNTVDAVVESWVAQILGLMEEGRGSGGPRLGRLDGFGDGDGVGFNVGAADVT